MQLRIFIRTCFLGMLCVSALFADDMSLSTSFYHFRDAKERFELELPQIWEIVRTSKAALITGAPRDRKTSKFRPNVNLIVDFIGPNMTLEDLFKANVAYAQSALKQFRVLSIANVSLGVLSAMKMVYVCRVLSKGVTLDMKNTVYCTLYQNHFYILTCSVLIDQYEDYFGVFERIGNSLRIY